MTAGDGPSAFPSSSRSPAAPASGREAPATDAVRADLDELAAAVDIARTAVAKGAYVDLGGMDRRVEGLCADLTRLPPVDAKALEPVLAGLIAALDALAADLSGQNGGAADRDADRAAEPVDDRAAAEAAARARARAAYRSDR